MPATPSWIVKPFCFRMPVRYFDVSNSWKPSSAKLNTMSFIFWMFSPHRVDFQADVALVLIELRVRGAAAAARAGCGGGCCGERVSETVIAISGSAIEQQSRCTHEGLQEWPARL